LIDAIHFPYALTVAREILPTNSTAFLRISGSSIFSMSRDDERVFPSDVESSDLIQGEEEDVLEVVLAGCLLESMRAILFP
jgi:hypothetical protein